MKTFIYIFGIGLIGLVGSLLVLWRYNAGESGAVSKERIETEIEILIADKLPDFSIEPYGRLTESAQERLSLGKILPDIFAFDRTEVAGLVRLMETCDPAFRLPSENGSLRKAFIFAELQCGILAAPPEGFFQSPPYIHPLGRSYILRAHEALPATFDREWLRRHRDYLHVTELQTILPGEENTFRGLARLGVAERRAWVQGRSLIVDGDNLWVLNAPPEERQTSESLYRVYKLAYVNSNLGRAGLKLYPPGKGDCLVNDPGYCILADDLGVRTRYWAFRVLVASAILLTVALITLLVLWSYNRSRTRRERMMVLQTLAHELRTPVTSMGLSFELLRAEFDRLSPEGQSSYLRMADDIRRLKRLIEGSRSYLTADASSRFVKEKVELDGFLNRIVEGYHDKITYQPPPSPLFVSTHPYWLGICLTNLIENALKHGKAPVRVIVSSGSGYPTISVEDCGSMSKKEYQRLRGEFRRGKNSAGMGLGLSIVSDTLRKLGHKLDFIESPTRFSITLEEA